MGDDKVWADYVSMAAINRFQRDFWQTMRDDQLLRDTARMVSNDGTVGVVAADQGEHRDGPFVFRGTLDEVMGSLAAIRESIPEPFRAEAVCEIESEGGYEGEHHVRIEVSYRRPATEDEKRASAAARATLADRERAEDLRKLDVLKAKLGRS